MKLSHLQRIFSYLKYLTVDLRLSSHMQRKQNNFKRKQERIIFKTYLETFMGYPNTEKRVENTTRSGVSDESRVVWIVDNHCLECFMYLLS